MCEDSNADGIDVRKSSTISKFKSGVKDKIDFWEHAEENYNQKQGLDRKVGHGMSFHVQGDLAVICCNSDL